MSRGVDDGGLTASLARYAERCGDPTDRVFARLFDAYPETRSLFLLDRNGAARGNMLANVIQVLEDLDGANDYAANMIEAEVLNHLDMGVPRTLFFAFFPLLAAEIREGLASEWGDSDVKAWDVVLRRVEAIAGETQSQEA